jgi:N6-adenosine-specific RNA methylase IME4
LIAKSLGQYKTVVIDPPWTVKNGFVKEEFFRFGRELPYKTMSDEEIKNFPINDFANEECTIFMWVVHSKIEVALAILQEWGFKLHLIMTRDKRNGVCINGFYRNTELCLVAYRGRLNVDIGEGNYIPALFSEQSTVHSRKPDKFYALLQARTFEPRIDIFARKRHYGFDAYGDQVEKQMTVPLTLEACY